MCDLVKLLEEKVSDLGDILEGMFQSPVDSSSDGYYDFFFSSGGFITRVLVDESEEYPLELKLHLCIHIDEDTGVVSRRINFIEADEEHGFVADFDAKSVCETFSDYGKLANISCGMVNRANAFLEDFRLKTGIVFDLMPSMGCTRGTLYSGVNAVFFKPV